VHHAKLLQVGPAAKPELRSERVLLQMAHDLRHSRVRPGNCQQLARCGKLPSAAMLLAVIVLTLAGAAGARTLQAS